MTDTVCLHRFIYLALRMLYRRGKYHAVDQLREICRANAVNIMPAENPSTSSHVFSRNVVHDMETIGKRQMEAIKVHIRNDLSCHNHSIWEGITSERA